MKLTQKAIKAIHTPDVRRELSGIFKCTDQTIIRYINRNDELGPLTTAGAMEVIRKWTNMTNQEILEHEEEVATK
jgi:hypothetical protein